MKSILRYGTLISATVIFLMVPASALECYAELSSHEAHSDMPIARCGFGTAFCIKYTFPDMTGTMGRVERNCDSNGACFSTGPGCFYNDFTSSQLCCCNSDRCNSASASTHHLLLLLCSVFLVLAVRYF
ncbi:hypothetical protein Tcan_12876 [Toxocara canis]|uniref:UPAR/Ly6 domain-containing protein n=1 Tax=Toxocara canis TaxID=6265 RepID=A0A0B2UXV3_TOXCA|nr:hypothetical protein Tcan_12876 [Toxocara canis]